MIDYEKLNHGDVVMIKHFFAPFIPISAVYIKDDKSFYSYMDKAIIPEDQIIAVVRIDDIKEWMINNE